MTRVYQSISIAILTILVVGCGVNPEHRYVITGEIGELLEEGKNHRLVVTHDGYNKEGRYRLVTLLDKKIVNGSVNFEGEILRPTAVQISIEEMRRGRFFINTYSVPVNQVEAVLEPHAEIRLVYRGRNQGLVADGTGKHAKLVASWMMSATFLSKLEEMGVAQAEFEAQQIAEREAAEARTTDGTDTTEDLSETSSEASKSAVATEVGDAENELIASVSEVEVAAENQDLIADGDPVLGDIETAAQEELTECEIAAQDVADDAPDIEHPKFMARYDELMEIQYEALDALARDSSDPIDALLAMELGALTRTHEGIERLDELAEHFDANIVATRISPRRSALDKQLKRVAADESLVPGQIAPEFTIEDLDGNNVSLASVLSEKEVVLLDFCASWCGPCIATFPDLKEMYKEYGDDGFEIVAVSIDSGREDWEEAVEEHEISWVNLGEVVDNARPVTDSYGVLFIPKGYVIEPGGCIVKKDLSTEKLKEFLAQRFDSPETEETGTGLDVAESEVTEVGS